VKSLSAIAIAVLVLAACGDATAPETTSIASPGPDDVLVTVHRGGGLCVDGPCSTTWTIYGSGSVEVDDDLIDAPVLSASQLEELLAARATGVGGLPPFTDTCPEAYDGPRWTYTFDEQVVDSCVDDVTGSGLIALIHELLDLGAPYV
jgi:hypothetical protein